MQTISTSFIKLKTIDLSEAHETEVFAPKAKLFEDEPLKTKLYELSKDEPLAVERWNGTFV